jgi:molybdopterin molybdotransferase
MSVARTRLRPAEAADIVLGAVSTLPVERVPLGQARSRVLAAIVRSPIDVPHWDNSAMDGYAVRSQDIGAVGRRGGAAPTVELQIVEEIPAGTFPTRTLGPRECARIFTGAPLPRGADCVIRQEDATRLDAGTVRIDDPRDAGRNVRRCGEDIPKGSVVLEPGVELGAAQLGVLAALAYPEVTVYRRPRIALLSTGDELTDPSDREAILTGRKIASSNSYTMMAMAQAAGADAIDMGIARDDPADIRTRLEGAADADLLVTSGGMSVGEHDHLRTLLQEGRAEPLFWRLRMRPGAPVGFGRYAGVPWIGLPGNPVSTMVTFELFVRPAIRRLMGHSALFRRTTPVLVGERVITQAPLQHFLRVRLTVEHGLLTAWLTGPQGSGILSSMARADALMIVSEDRQDIPAGDTLPAILLNEPVHVPVAPY